MQIVKYRKESIGLNEMSDASSVEKALLLYAKNNAIPVSGSLELLPLCNMNCEMCYVRLNKNEMEQRGHLRSIEEWIWLAEEMNKAGVLFLLLTGGEPLLYPEFQELYLRLKQLGMILTVNTNGTLLDASWADFFMEHKPRRINITLYGTNQTSYEKLCHYPQGYEKTIQAVKLLKQRNVEIKLNGSAVKANRKEIEQIFEIGKALEVPVWIESYMYPVERERPKPYQFQVRLEPSEAAQVWHQSLKNSLTPEEYEEYRKELLCQIGKKEGTNVPTQGTECMAANCSFSINWQGNMRPCVMLSEPSIPVFETGFSSAWNQLRGEVQQKIRLPKGCVSCNLKFLCRVCPASAGYECGQTDGNLKYLCELARETFEVLK